VPVPALAAELTPALAVSVAFLTDAAPLCTLVTAAVPELEVLLVDVEFTSL